PWTGWANSDQRTSMAIDIQTRRNIDIINCNFNNKGACIRLIDAQVDVYSDLPEASVFTNSEGGILMKNTISGLNSPHNIYGCTFDNISFAAILSMAGKYDNIHENVFGSDHTYFPHIEMGIALVASSDHEITENEFFRANNGILGMNCNTGFIGAKAPGYFGNQFTNCRTGIITSGNNQYLTLKCNQHTPDYFGVIPYDDNWKNYGILSNQGLSPFGMNACTDTRCPAGNRFWENSMKHIYSSQNNNYVYWRHVASSTVYPELIPVESVNNIPYTIGILPSYQDWQGQTISCQPVVGSKSYNESNPLPPLDFNIEPYNKIDSLQNMIDSLEIVKSNIISNLDNGETRLLLDAIETYHSPKLLSNLLIASSPLSDTVLIALLTSENGMPPPMFTLVMLKNLPVSNGVSPYFYQRFEELPPHFQNLLADYYTNPGAETPALVQSKIAEKERLKLDFTRRLVNILCDTIHNRHEDALLLLEHEGSLNSIKTIIASHIENEQYTMASAELTLISQDTEENIDFVYISHTLLDLYQQGKTLYQADSLDMENIRALAYKCPPSIAVVNARTILEILFNEIVPECPYEMENKDIALSNNHASNEYYFTDDVESALLGENYPDPFGISTKIPYSIPEGITASIVIHDMDGKIIKIYKNISGDNEIDFTGMEIPGGTYLYSLIIEDMVFETKKMIK
ncbi:MAG: T9SS type A sorting domain-containing protein, partial [Bacteroidota bacterium]